MYSLQGILVQDVDSGAPCLKCKEKCTGFSLHVWRYEHISSYVMAWLCTCAHRTMTDILYLMSWSTNHNCLIIWLYTNNEYHLSSI